MVLSLKLKIADKINSGIGKNLVIRYRGCETICCDTLRYCNQDNTAGKISTEHVTIFLSKYISKGAVDMTFSPDVGLITQEIHPYK